jgi:hypothetical protein
MTDDEITELVRAKLADGTLPRQQPVIAQPVVPGRPMSVTMEGGSALAYPCAACGDRPTQFYYTDARLAFDERCHRIWLKEANKLW